MSGFFFFFFFNNNLIVISKIVILCCTCCNYSKIFLCDDGEALSKFSVTVQILFFGDWQVSFWEVHGSRQSTNFRLPYPISHRFLWGVGKGLWSFNLIYFSRVNLVFGLYHQFIVFLVFSWQPTTEAQIKFTNLQFQETYLSTQQLKQLYLDPKLLQTKNNKD